MSLKFPISLVGKMVPEYIPPYETIAYDINGNVLATTTNATLPTQWFYNNTNIYRLEIGTSCVRTGAQSFQGATNLQGTNKLDGHLYIPDSVTRIDPNCFFNCSFSTLRLSPNLTRIERIGFSSNGFTGDLVIPDGVTFIGYSAFNVNNFSTITVGPNITNIEFNAFRSNPNCTEVKIYAVTAPTIGGNVFTGMPASTPIRVPSNATGYAASYNGLTVVYDLPAG